MTYDTRMRHLKLSLFALLAATALLVSPRLVQRLSAQTDSTCGAECERGKCTASGPSCSCTCSFWLGLPLCNCQPQENETVPPPNP